MNQVHTFDHVIPRDSLYTLEAYAQQRGHMRKEVLAEKAQRRIFLGDNIVLIFESELLIRYQIQEMLRIEKTFDEAGIIDELTAYRPLVPDARNWIATMQIEYDDIEARKQALASLIDIEHAVWLRIADGDKIFAIANEDLERSTAEKTSAIHFLRFKLSEQQATAAQQGGSISAGVDHQRYGTHSVTLSADTQAALKADLQNGIPPRQDV